MLCLSVLCYIDLRELDLIESNDPIGHLLSISLFNHIVWDHLWSRPYAFQGYYFCPESDLLCQNEYGLDTGLITERSYLSFKLEDNHLSLIPVARNIILGTVCMPLAP